MKKLNFVLMLCLLCSICIGVFRYVNFVHEPKDVITFGSEGGLEYKELENEANIIALVKVKDKLSKKNSTIIYQEDSPFIKYHYATREVEVLEYYKNDLKLGKTIKFNEKVAITPNNEYIHDKDYDALQKGGKYIVYLSIDNGLGELSLMGSNNGKVDLDNFSDNEYKEIAVQSILKADGVNLSDDITINFDVPENSNPNKDNKDTIIKKLKNKDIDLPIQYYFNEETSTQYINIAGIDFSVNEEIYNE